VLSFSRRLSSSRSGWIACVPSGAVARFALAERREGGRPAVRWVHEEGWSDVAKALRHARHAGPLARHRCVALLQRTQYQMLPMDAPDVPREDWRAAVRWKLKDMVEFAVETAGVDVLEVPPEASSRRQAALIAVAAPADALRPLVEAGDEAGVRWQALDVPETALRNLSALFAAEGRSHALLHLGETHGTLVITTGGELLLSRQIDVTQAQIADENEAMRQLAFDRAGLELQRTLDGFERVFTQTSLERLHVLPAPGLTPFCDYVRDLVYVPVAEADPAEMLDLQAVPALQQDPQALQRYLLAIGAALRTD
jgi:MSHA biogenesis protein MshI